MTSNAVTELRHNTSQSSCQNRSQLTSTLYGGFLCRFLALIALTAQTVVAQENDKLGGASRPRPQLKLTREDRQYKRVHQYALRLILRDRKQEAEDFLVGFLERHPGDEETQYMLALLKSRQGDTDGSIDYMRSAIEDGLPPARLIAGPRSLFRNVANTDFFRSLVDKHRSTAVHGPLIGNVTDQSASIWLRTATESNVKVRASLTRDFLKPMMSATVRSKSEHDYTCVVPLEGLPANASLYYQVSIAGAPFESSEVYSFRTFPTESKPAKFTIAFGGGAGFVPPHERMWDTIRNEAPLALLLLGDNTYIDDPESPEMQSYTYQRRQSRPEYRRLTRQTGRFYDLGRSRLQYERQLGWPAC